MKIKELLKQIDFTLRVDLFVIWMNEFASIGFEILTIDNLVTDRSLLSVLYNPDLKRIWIGILFFNFKFYL